MDVDTESAWTALIARDPSLVEDEGCVYAVRTTGVYCRIGCGSRRPLRANVEFFTDPDAAEAHGFRPCQRCHPRDRFDSSDAAVRRVRDACDLMIRDVEHRLVADIAADIGVSARHLDRTFTSLTGVSVADYRRQVGRGRARSTLRSESDVTSAIWAAGFRSSHNFYEQVVPTLGMKPREYRRGGQGRTVRYTIVDHPIGQVMIAATSEGVCAVRLGDDAGQLEQELREEFHRADVRPDDNGLRDYASLVIELADGRPPSGPLPLDIEGTAFQVQVWKALSQVPRGESVTYGELARRIGRPTASRAVGAAVGANPVAVVVPCHRVVRSDGGLGGYHWGVERKVALRDAESASTPDVDSVDVDRS